MANQLGKGMLVEWQGLPHAGHGVIENVENHRIGVRWDSGERTTFSATDHSLIRVRLSTGLVARRSTSGAVVIVRELEDVEPPTWECLTGSDPAMMQRVNIPEADLRPRAIVEPVERFQASQIGPTDKYLLRQVASHYLNRHMQDDLVSLGQSQVDIQPHQVSAVHTVTQTYPHRFLLCDETGLGKTIEAGMIIKELRARRGAQRILIITPANLVRQWQFEMRSKFNEEFAILNRDTVGYLRQQGHDGNPFAHKDYDSVIVSNRWITGAPWREWCLDAQWDLVVVDEAHHARRHRDGTTTQLYDLLADLIGGSNSRTRAALLLTATPMQLDPMELYGMVELLNPTLFASEDDFERHSSDMRGLSRLVERISHSGAQVPDSFSAEDIDQIAHWLAESPDAVRNRLAAGETGISETLRLLMAQHRLSEIMLRNRKAHVGGFMPRTANRWPVNMTNLERTALRAIEDYVTYGYSMAEANNDNAIGFLMTTYQKLTASSHAAIRASLRRRKERLSSDPHTSTSLMDAEELEEALDDDREVIDVLDESSAMGRWVGDKNGESALLDRAIDALDALGETDSKAEAFLDKLQSIFAQDGQEKVLVFTQFRETQNLIARACESRGWGVNVFHGQLNRDQKDSAIERFRTSNGPQVLVSTEAGGEGRNLQFCHWLVNYDLPWNPMRVEQRIGRIDRIGQNRVVMIGNLYVTDSIEERVLDVLEHRIHAFEQIVGVLDEILGDAETDIRRIMALAEEQRAAAIEDFAQRHEQRRRAAIAAGNMLGDFIMDTKSFRREIVERITGQTASISQTDFGAFILRLAGDVGTHIQSIGEDSFSLRFQGQFLDQFRQQLFPDGPVVRATLRRDALRAMAGETLMAFGHPIVDKIMDLVLADDYPGNTGTRVIQSGDHLPPTTGWLFHYQFVVPVPRETEILLHVFVDDSGLVDLDIGEALVVRATRFSDEQPIAPDQIPDNLQDSRKIADLHAMIHRAQVQDEAQRESQERFAREAERIEALFEYQERIHADRIASLESRIAEIESLSETQQRILPALRGRLRHAREAREADAQERQLRLDELNKIYDPQVSWSLAAIGRIHVVP